MTSVDVIVIIAYLLGILALGLWAGRRARLKDSADFFLGGRRFAWWAVGTSMVATTVAADTPLAVAGITIRDGVAGNWFWWAFIGSHVLVSVVLARLWRRAEVVTDAEFCELRYQDGAAPALRAVKAFYYAVPINCFIMGFVFLAMLKIAGALLPELDEWAVIAALLVMTLIYSVRSGYAAVVVTDLVQFPIAILGAIVLAAFALDAAGGLGAVVEHVRATRGPEALELFPVGSDALPWHLAVAFLGVQWWAQKGADGGGIFVQRLSSARSEADAERGGLWFMVGHYVLRPWPWILTGLAATVLLDPATVAADPEATYPALIGTVLPEGLRGLLVASFLAAFMSTIDTHLNWGASYLVHDLAERFGLVAPERVTRASRGAVIGLAGVAVLFTLGMDSIRDAWEFVIAFGAGTGAVILLRWYWWRITAAAELAAMLASTVLAVVVYAVAPSATEVDVAGVTVTLGAGLPYLAKLAIIVPGSALVWIPVTWLSAPSPESLVPFYRQVRPSGPGWRRVAQVAGEPVETTPLLVDLGRWLVGVVSVAACLLGLGRALLHEPVSGLIALGLGLVGMVWLGRGR